MSPTPASAAMLAALDEGMGRVLEAVRGAGLEEDTLIICFSENGGPTLLGTSINGSRNDPLRGSKRTTLEGGVRVPFVLSWKGQLPAGATYNHPVIQLDVLPTALAAAGVDAGADARLDGVDLLPYLKGDRAGAPHERLFWRFGPQIAIREGDWKLVRYDAAVDAPGVRSNPAEGTPVTEARLYNLAEDAGEANDLAAAHPEKVAALLASWKAWDAELVAPLWGPAGRRVARAK